MVTIFREGTGWDGMGRSRPVPATNFPDGSSSTVRVQLQIAKNAVAK